MTMNPKRVLFATLVSALLFSPNLLTALRAQESVAAAARKAQAQKKSSAKPVTVFTNDNIDTVKGTVNVVGETPAPPADKTATAQDKTKTPPTVDKSKTAPADDKTGSTKDEAYWRKAFADARKKLADDTHELDILQREYNLKQQQYYSDPNTAMREQYNRQDLTDTKIKLTRKPRTWRKKSKRIPTSRNAWPRRAANPGGAPR